MKLCELDLSGLGWSPVAVFSQDCNGTFGFCEVHVIYYLLELLSAAEGIVRPMKAVAVSRFLCVGTFILF